MKQLLPEQHYSTCLNVRGRDDEPATAILRKSRIKLANQAISLNPTIFDMAIGTN